MIRVNVLCIKKLCVWVVVTFASIHIQKEKKLLSNLSNTFVMKLR